MGAGRGAGRGSSETRLRVETATVMYSIKVFAVPAKLRGEMVSWAVPVRYSETRISSDW
jgi:hypothetical protein